MRPFSAHQRQRDIDALKRFGYSDEKIDEMLIVRGWPPVGGFKAYSKRTGKKIEKQDSPKKPGLSFFGPNG